MGKSAKPRVIPEQDGRIIGIICLCQMTMVLSGVALAYLSMAVYVPSYKAFTAGFETTPIMCDTVNMTIVNNCPWTSCGEWCLSKPSGYCAQIYVNARKHGSNLTLSGCSRPQRTNCPKANVDILSRINCTKKNHCVRMRGLFSCKGGYCANVSEVLQCTNQGEGHHIEVGKGTETLEGNYECYGARCWKVKSQLKCDHICPRIVTTSNNVFLSAASTVIGARCSSAAATDPSAPWPSPAQLWTPSDGTLLASCYTYNISGDTITATDCVNGTMIPPFLLPQPTMNFTQFRNIWRIAMEEDHFEKPRPNVVPRGGALLPPSRMLFVHDSSSMLYINTEKCVNTLRGECRDFLENYGSDGKNNTAFSRFPCFYKKSNSSVVLARFDLKETGRELIVAIVLPTILFVVSLTTLCVITRTVKVGDDAKLRCLSRCSSVPAREEQQEPDDTT